VCKQVPHFLPLLWPKRDFCALADPVNILAVHLQDTLVRQPFSLNIFTLDTTCLFCPLTFIYFFSVEKSLAQFFFIFMIFQPHLQHSVDLWAVSVWSCGLSPASLAPVLGHDKEG